MPYIVKNQLVSDQRRADHLVQTGQYYPEERGSGRSTTIALIALVEAMKNPGVPVPLKDHHDSRAADEFLARGLRTMIDQLGLRLVQVQRSKRGWEVLANHVELA